MKLPYAISDFEDCILNGYYYIDRTDRIPMMEQVGKYLLFLRPRRFGKSLWLSTMKNYYDIAKTDKFERMFGKLFIGKNPTPLHNKYFVLKWDFSCVDSSGSLSEIKKSLFSHMNSRIIRFSSYYSDYLPLEIEIDEHDAVRSFESLLGSIGKTDNKLYLFIDEYDNFANEMMARRREDDYYRMTGLDGFLKSLFKSMKSATEGHGLDRMFITGVTPILMSDVTSGDNISTDIHMMPRYADLCGFAKEEVEQILKTFADWLEKQPRFLFPQDVPMFPQGKEEWTESMLNLMNNWYNGYYFSKHKFTSVYNPTLIMFLLRQITEHDGQLPDSLIDANLVADEGRLEFIADLPGGKEVLMELMQENCLELKQLIPRFGLRTMLSHEAKSRSFMGSYLYFMGMLTLSDRDSEYGNILLTVPNPVIKKLYINGVAQWLVPNPMIRDSGEDAADMLCTRGDIKPLCEFIEKQVFPSFSWRDRRWANELTIKTIFLSLLFNDINYLMASERETRSGYADLAMIVRPDRKKYKLLDVLVEFKFIRLKDLDITKEQLLKKTDQEILQVDKIKDKLVSAKNQAARYSGDLKAEFGDFIKLKTFVVIAIGFERILYIPHE
ncbi:MAG: AAA family ATPase [Desulfobacteraceae bacterium]|nr:AAA family ATPase [Desulfobacteraceae bacterium]